MRRHYSEISAEEETNYYYLNIDVLGCIFDLLPNVSIHALRFVSKKTHSTIHLWGKMRNTMFKGTVKWYWDRSNWMNIFTKNPIEKKLSFDAPSHNTTIITWLLETSSNKDFIVDEMKSYAIIGCTINGSTCQIQWCMNHCVRDNKFTDRSDFSKYSSYPLKYDFNSTQYLFDISLLIQTAVEYKKDNVLSWIKRKSDIRIFLDNLKNCKIWDNTSHYWFSSYKIVDTFPSRFKFHEQGIVGLLSTAIKVNYEGLLPRVVHAIMDLEEQELYYLIEISIIYDRVSILKQIVPHLHVGMDDGDYDHEACLDTLFSIRDLFDNIWLAKRSNSIGMLEYFWDLAKNHPDLYFNDVEGDGTFASLKIHYTEKLVEKANDHSVLEDVIYLLEYIGSNSEIIDECKTKKAQC